MDKTNRTGRQHFENWCILYQLPRSARAMILHICACLFYRVGPKIMDCILDKSFCLPAVIIL